MNKAEYWIDKLQLLPHPEGGWYKEVYRSEEEIQNDSLPHGFKGSRSYMTSIYFLLGKKDISRFHILGSDEIWYYNQGCSCTIQMIDKAGNYSNATAGPEGEMQVIIPNNTYFAAEVNPSKEADFILVSCAVAPGFDFQDFRLVEQQELEALCPTQRELISRFT